jgi:signal transduction histidine kinase
MRKDNSQLYITVEDNGIGFSGPSVTYNGYGLFNIRERMNHINGHFEIKSKPGRGTKVTLIAPLKINN